MKQRIVTAILAGIPLIILVAIGGAPFIVLTILLAFAATSELLKMNRIPYFSPLGLTGFLLTFMLVLPDHWHRKIFSFINSKQDGLLLILLILLALTVISKNRINFSKISFVFMGALYAGFGFYFFNATRAMENGLPIFFFILFSIWATDSGAYFVGRAFGRRKLWPEISPKKTIEGAVGGIASAILLAVVFQLIYPLFTYIWAILVAFIVAVFGQVGDLAESALKRYYGVKDSGNLLPGHGGILDRFDSLLFVLPILHLFHLI